MSQANVRPGPPGDLTESPLHPAVQVILAEVQIPEKNGALAALSPASLDRARKRLRASGDVTTYAHLVAMWARFHAKGLVTLAEQLLALAREGLDADTLQAAIEGAMDGAKGAIADHIASVSKKALDGSMKKPKPLGVGLRPKGHR